MKRVLCVWFPNWPLQRICHAQPELKQRPVVLYGDSPRGGLQVVARSRRAAAKGILPGMPLAEAKGISASGQQSAASGQQEKRHSPLANSQSNEAFFVRHDPPTDLAALRQLAGSCRCFSPRTGIEESETPECLLLDITGCEHLFGGEDALAEQLAQQLDQQGYVARLAIANTVGAAWAIVHYGVGVERGEGREESQKENERDAPALPSPLSTLHSHPSPLSTLAPLPVEALRLPPRILQTLHELDIRRIEQLQALPRQTLASRFGAEVARRLDQATGETEELITSVRLSEPVEAACSFEEPVASRDALQMVVRQLLDKITCQLESSQQGVRSLLVHLGFPSSFNRQPEACDSLARGVSGEAHVESQGVSFTVGLVQPRASARHLFELIEMKFERLTLTSPVTNVLLRATTTTRLLKQQHNILGTPQTQQSQQLLAALLERMSSRLGEKAVVRPQLDAEFQPEYGFRLKAVVRREGSGKREEGSGEWGEPRKNTRPLALSSPRSPLPSSRPLQLEPTPIPIRVISVVPNGPPLRFDWRDQEHGIARYWGPERIEAGWWREREAQRDYYRVETESGQQFWVFRCLRTREWFLQGAFG